MGCDVDKSQAIHQFWSGFGLKAYDDASGVPKDVSMPYITYNVQTDSLGNQVFLNGSLWYDSTSWSTVSRKAEEIAEAIGKMDPPSVEIEGGRLYLTKGTPFATRMSDPSKDTIKRIYINVIAEFLTAY